MSRIVPVALMFLVTACASAPEGGPVSSSAEPTSMRPPARSRGLQDDARQRRGAMMGAMAGALRDWITEPPEDKPLIR
jgi:hypothetical protein